MTQYTPRILFCTTLDNQILHFHIPYIQWLRSRGHQVDVASSGSADMPFCDTKFHVPFTKNPVSTGNLAAFRMLRRILHDGRYDLVHCHSPSAGAIARLAVRSLPRKSRPVVFYTAHGFHFFQGAPKAYWLLVFPLERLLARFTDCLLVMNDEDFETVTKYRFRAGRIVRVPGVGVDLDLLDAICVSGDRESLRKKHGYRESDYLLFYAAELSERKNQAMLLDALERLVPGIPGIRLLLAGRDLLDGALQADAERRGLSGRVDFLGHREDVAEWLLLSDAVVASSRQEGLPVNLIEAMACGRPVIATAVRGHVDLISSGVNGMLVPDDDAETLADAVLWVHDDPNAAEAMGAQAAQDARAYSLHRVLEVVGDLYEAALGRKRGEGRKA